jgi:hypothetical protein
MHAPALLVIRLACRSDDAFAGIDQTFDGTELAVNAVEMEMVDDDSDYYSNRDDKGEDTCHEKTLDGDHLNLSPLARSADASKSKVEKARKKDISPRTNKKGISPKGRIFMTNLDIWLSNEPEYPTRDASQPV